MRSRLRGGTRRRSAALNCSPCSRSVTQRRAASRSTRGVTLAAEPTRLTRSRCPGTSNRQTQKPFFGLWKAPPDGAG